MNFYDTIEIYKLGVDEYHNGQYFKAKMLFQRTLTELGEVKNRQETELLQSCYEYLADASIKLNELEEALKVAELALKVAEGLKNKERIANSYKKLAIAHSMLGKTEKKHYDESVRYYLKSILLWKELGNNEMLGYAYMDLAFDSFKLGAHPDYHIRYTLTAVLYFQKAIKENDNPELHFNLGKAYDYLGFHTYRTLEKDAEMGIKRVGEVLKRFLDKILTDQNLKELRKDPDIAFLTELMGSYVQNPQMFDFKMKLKAMQEYKIYANEVRKIPRELSALCKFFSTNSTEAQELLEDYEWKLIVKLCRSI